MDGDDGNPGEMARRLVRSAAKATLTTILRRDGWPYGSLVLLACDHDGSPLLLLSRLAEHTRNVVADGRVSLLVDGTTGHDEPLSGPRVTVLGRAAESREPRHRARFLARHPEAEGYAGLGDFAFYRVALTRAHLVAGFGRVHWLAADGVLFDVSGSGPLMEAEGDIIAHMNDAHAGAVDLYAKALLGEEGEGWRVTGCDPEGCDLRLGAATARLPFDSPVTDRDGARAALMGLLERARARGL